MIDPLVYRDPASFEAVFEQSSRNWAAWVPELPGCISTGATREECERNIREAIAGHLEAMWLYGDGPGIEPLPGRSLPIPKPTDQDRETPARAS